MGLDQNTPLPFLDSNQFSRNGYNSEGVTARSGFALARFCDNFLIMKVETLEKQVELLRILVDGCKTHPAYRAIRPATGRCKPCVEMWQARQKLIELNK